MTASKPRRTMLPPNLTRNLYETRRLLAADEGKELPPWFALTAEQRKVAERDMDVFRRAILRAEEEQDLVASATATPDTATPFTDPAAADCPCPGCILEDAVLQLLKWAERRKEARQAPVDSPNRFPFNVSEVRETGPGRTPTAAEKDRTRTFFDQWVTDQSIDTVLDPATLGVWTFEAPPLTRDDVDRLTKKILRDQSRYPLIVTDSWAKRPPTVGKA